jgi:hypothetical protein
LSRERFSASDARWALAIAAIIVACSLYIRLDYSKGFPQASIKLRLSKAQVTAIAASITRYQFLRREKS